MKAEVIYRNPKTEIIQNLTLDIFLDAKTLPDGTHRKTAAAKATFIPSIESFQVQR